MTDEVEWCFEDDDVDEIVEIMSRLQIRRLPVVARDKRLVGIVALGDLATDQENAAARALHRISTPSEPHRSGTPSTSRADRTRDRRPERLAGDERRQLDERRRSADGERDDEARRGAASQDRLRAGRASSGADRPDFRLGEEDDERAAFGSFGRPGEERGRNPQMPGGFGGDGYRNYGEAYDRHTTGPGGGFPQRRASGSDLLGRTRQPADDPSPDDRRAQNIERAYSLANEDRDRRNYGVGPGNTRFGNDATGSAGEARRGEHGGRGPRSYQRSDERICEDVSERLTDDPVVDAGEIEVTVTGREVTLSGAVRTRAERRRAEDLAEGVSGVTHVQNNLRVAQHQESHRTGAEAGDSGAATGDPGIGTAGTGAGSPSGGRSTDRAARTRQIS